MLEEGDRPTRFCYFRRMVRLLISNTPYKIGDRTTRFCYSRRVVRLLISNTLYKDGDRTDIAWANKQNFAVDSPIKADIH